jgi:hypothetical protein
MKIRSAILTEMSGKLGGAVGSESRGGIQYLRKLVIPSNPQTALQTANRNGVAGAASYWRSSLSAANQALWEAIATGSETGQTLFSKVNNARLYANSAGLTVAVASGITPLPVLQVPPASLSTLYSGCTAVVDDSSNNLTVTNSNVNDAFLAESDYLVGAACGVQWIYITPQQNYSRLSRQHPYRLARVTVNGGPGVAAQVIDLAALGLATTAGQIMYFRTVVQTPTGALSISIEKRITIQA